MQSSRSRSIAGNVPAGMSPCGSHQRADDTSQACPTGARRARPGLSSRLPDMAHGDLAQTVALIGAARHGARPRPEGPAPARRRVRAYRRRRDRVRGLARASSDSSGSTRRLSRRARRRRGSRSSPSPPGSGAGAALVPVALLLAAPFRLPVDLGSQHAFLLIPFYAVLAAACLALARARRSAGARPRVPLLLACRSAAFVVLDAVSLLWAAISSRDGSSSRSSSSRSSRSGGRRPRAVGTGWRAR